MAPNTNLKLTRQQLSLFIKDHNTLVQFERLIKYMNSLIPADETEIAIDLVALTAVVTAMGIDLDTLELEVDAMEDPFITPPTNSLNSEVAEIKKVLEDIQQTPSNPTISEVAELNKKFDGLDDTGIPYWNEADDRFDTNSTLNRDSSGNITIEQSLIIPKTTNIGIKVDTAAPTFGWRDLLGNITDAGGSNKPTRTTYRGGIDQFLFAAGDEAILEFHIPHDYTPGTDLYLHVHWSHISTLVTGGTVTFTAESSYAKGFNQAPFQAPVTGTFIGTASTTQYQHIISEAQYSAAAPAGLQLTRGDLEVDGVIFVRLEMTTNNITSSGAVPDVFIHYVDIHYQSTNMATKAKAPDFYT